MATTNRSALINRTLKVLKKHFKPSLPPKERTLLEHLLLACLLENSPHDVAEQVFASLQQNYFDWNEVRVSTVQELSEVFKPLADPIESATRLKHTLHSVFESVYQFDLEAMKKQNIGQSTKQMDQYTGSTPFVVSYVTQNALGGHSIPINQGLLLAFQVIGVISESEAAKGTVPGLERVVPKSKGVEVGSILHQLGIEVGRSPYGQAARKLLLEIAPDCKNRLPKRPVKKAKPEATKAKKVPTKKAKPAAAKSAPSKAAITTKAPEKQPPKKKKTPLKKKTTTAKKSAPPSKKTEIKKKPKAKVIKKKAVKKKKKTASTGLSKRKPR